MRRWYEIKAAGKKSEVWIYDEIGAWGIGAKEFIVELNEIKSGSIDMHINSPGGEVFDGAAMFNAIRRHPADVTTYIDGIAASIASVIALAGDRVIIAENGLYMMHNPWGLAMGTAEDMRATADVLDKVRDTMLNAYTEASGKSDQEILDMLDAETWMNADEALAAGFVDSIGEELDLAACAKFAPVWAKIGANRVPRALSDGKPEPTTKDIERALHEVGCSVKAAKAILAEGYQQDRPRDVGQPEEPSVTVPPRDVAQPKLAKVDRTEALLAR